MSLFTIQVSDGRHFPAVLPVSNTVTGSPFTSGAASAPTPKLKGLYRVTVAGQPVHVRFDKDTAVAADGNDMLLPVGVHHFPCDNHVMSFIQEGSAGTIYVEKCLEI